MAPPGQSTIDKVAGPIGKALIMTALGLAVAIHAVLGYNALVRGNKSILGGLNSFAHDLHAYLVTGARVNAPEAESCNLADDDCDGTVDENAGLPCFTGGRGCVEGADGSFTCMGACTAGVQQCVGGMLEAACTGQVEADSTDGCTPPGAIALDADCDGSVDEDCTCMD